MVVATIKYVHPHTVAQKHLEIFTRKIATRSLSLHVAAYNLKKYQDAHNQAIYSRPKKSPSPQV
jgi:hypothetical protein